MSNTFLNNKKSKKLIMYWGDSLADWVDGKKNTGFLVMQFYPEEIQVSRTAEYDSFTPGLGIGDVKSFTGTSSVDIGSFTALFSRDREDNKFLWQNNYEYDVELVISTLYSLLTADYDNDGGIIDLPPQVWFDFGYDIFGYGDVVTSSPNNSNFVSRFYITSLSHNIESYFPGTQKIRAVSFDISVEETVYYDGQIDSARFSNAYRNATRRRLKRSDVKNGNMENRKYRLNYNVGLANNK